ncbi:topoisomerase II [Salix suchowensis]|nr:topoisomerase II [Salix suchowensis]
MGCAYLAIGIALQSLQGALGKTSGRSYKAAPRQLLQVDSSPTLGNTHAHISKQDSNDHAQQAKRLGQEALGQAADVRLLSVVIQQDPEPLAHREVLSMLEHLYDLVLQAEQLRRDQPLPDEQEELADWSHLPTRRRQGCPNSRRSRGYPERAEVDRQTQAFLTGGVIQSILPVMSKAPLRIVTGLLGLLLDRTDIAAITQTKPGLALLTLLLSRVEVIKQNTANSLEMLEVEEERPSPEEAHQW